MVDLLPMKNEGYSDVIGPRRHNRLLTSHGGSSLKMTPTTHPLVPPGRSIPIWPKLNATEASTNAAWAHIRKLVTAEDVYV